MDIDNSFFVTILVIEMMMPIDAYNPALCIWFNSIEFGHTLDPYLGPYLEIFMKSLVVYLSSCIRF